MKNIVLSNENGTRMVYRFSDLPFSGDVLEELVLLRYHRKTCDRCRLAVLQAGILRLLKELEKGRISDESFALFPILTKFTTIKVEEKEIWK